MDSKISRSDLEAQCAILVASAPPAVNRAIIEDGDFLKAIGLEINTTLKTNLGQSIKAEEFVRVLKQAVNGSSNLRLKTTSNEVLDVTAQIQPRGSLELTIGKGKLLQPFAKILSEDRAKRLSAFDRFVQSALLPPHRVEYWKGILQSSIPSAQEYLDLCGEGEATPEQLHDALQRPQSLSVSVMVPEDEHYWEALLPPSSNNLEEWHGKVLPAWKADRVSQKSKWKIGRLGFCHILQSDYPADFEKAVDDETLTALASHEDPFSLLLALELTAARIKTSSAALEKGVSLLNRLLQESSGSSRRNLIFAASAIISYSGLQQSMAWRKSPLYWRRMAVFAQAGVLTNALFRMVEDGEAFSAWAKHAAGSDFFWGTLCDRLEAPLWAAPYLEPSLNPMLAMRAYSIVMSVPEADRPKEWVEIVEKTLEELGKGGRIRFAMMPGPLSDFQGYQPPLDKEKLAPIYEDLSAGVPPGELRGVEVFVNAHELSAEDISLLRDYVKRMPPSDPETFALTVSFLGTLAQAAINGRDQLFADAIADRLVTLFFQVNDDLQRHILGIAVDLGNVQKNSDEAGQWVGRLFEQLAYRARRKEELANLEEVIFKLRQLKPTTQPYFSCADAIIQLRANAVDA